MKRRMLVRTVWLSVWILAATLAHPANAQAGDPARAQPHLDAARALVGPEHRYAVQRYAQIAGLEARAGRTQNARELTHLIQGLILELPEDQRDPALYHLAQSYLDRGETDDAVRILRQAQTPTMMVRNIHLRAVHQTTARFGLQRGIELAREFFPEIMQRRDVYCKMCYTLAINDQADLALEFIDVAMDLTEIFLKIDAYRFAAVGMYKRGDQAGAAGVLDLAYEQAHTNEVITTRIGMLLDLAQAYQEIGIVEQALAMMAQAEEAFRDIDPDDTYDRNSAVEKIAKAWALLGNDGRAIAWLAVAPEGYGHDAVYKTLIQNHLDAGEVDQARALNDEHDAFMFGKFETAAALAALERGQAEPAISHIRAQLGSAFESSDLATQAAAALARHGHHQPLQQFIAAIEDPDTRYHAHLGAAQGYLPEDDNTTP
ncbi:MAG: tetratricopeptide repeat protein [Phycisphaerales bacterium JB063]